VRHCARTPRTCALVERFPAAATCRRGQVKFSALRGGTRIWPHCGPTNTRLRAHLGLVVPPEPRLRVGDSPPRAWRRGKFIVFDDSFEHEVGETFLKRFLMGNSLFHYKCTWERSLEGFRLPRMLITPAR